MFVLINVKEGICSYYKSIYHLFYDFLVASGLPNDSVTCLHERPTDRLLDSGVRNTRRKRPPPRKVKELKTWFQNEGFLARAEIQYLSHMNGLDESLDLFALYELSEPEIQSIAYWIERLLGRVFAMFGKVSLSPFDFGA